MGHNSSKSSWVGIKSTIVLYKKVCVLPTVTFVFVKGHKFKKIILFQLLLPCPTRKLSVLCPLSHSSWWLWDWRETGWSSFRIDFTKFHWRVTSIRQRGMSSGSMVIRFQELRSIWRVVIAVQYHLLIFFHMTATFAHFSQPCKKCSGRILFLGSDFFTELNRTTSLTSRSKLSSFLRIYHCASYQVCEYVFQNSFCIPGGIWKPFGLCTVHCSSCFCTFSCCTLQSFYWGKLSTIGIIWIIQNMGWFVISSFLWL